MMTKIKPNYDEKRSNLAELVPLESPYTVIIEITRLCNFKCFYCMHSTKGRQDGSYNKIKLPIDNMNIEVFRKISKEISEMIPQPKRVLIQGLGEPLINNNLPTMIRQLRNDDFVGRIDIVTNGSLFNKRLADDIIDAGVSKIIISLQGMNSEEYKNNCQYDIDFESFIENLTYLYNHRKQTHIFIKIIDYMLKNEEEKNKFFEIFGEISDTCDIEHLVVNQIQMGDHQGKVNHNLNIYNEKILDRNICPMPFYQIHYFLDGTVLACPISGVSKELAIGNANTESLREIWNGKSRKRFLETMLIKKRFAYETCRNCGSTHCISLEEENLDNNYEEILKRMEKYYGIRD